MNRRVNFKLTEQLNVTENEYKNKILHNAVKSMKIAETILKD
jgi:hypothetical protein